ncbi:MAG: COR domain-containing protein [Pseudomonadota bacterium]
MILGNGQIGKTQLRRQLANGAFNAGLFDTTIRTTHGVEIDRGTLAPAAATPDAPATPLRIWDFGGQDIYLGTHALFLKSRAVFPVVWTEASEASGHHEAEGQWFKNRPLAYWARYVRTLAAAQSPVIFVRTQCDQPTDGRAPIPLSDADQAAFKYPPDHVRYSSRTGNGYEDLMLHLRRAVANVDAERGADVVGSGWVAVKARLEEMHAQDQARAAGDRAHHTLTWDEFLEVCRSVTPAVPEDQAPTLLAYLHDLGTVFHDGRAFDGLIILDQQWALDAIYTLFDRGDGADNSIHRHFKDVRRGQFTRTELAAMVWQGKSAAEQKLLLSMMRSCDICFPLSERDGVRGGDDNAATTVYLAPDLLPGEAEISGLLAGRWATATRTETVIFTFELLPDGLFRTIMSAIGAKVGSAGEYWDRGLFFFDAETKARARIREEPGANWGGAIYLETQTGDAPALLDALIEIVEQAFGKYGVKPKRELKRTTLKDVDDETRASLARAARIDREQGRDKPTDLIRAGYEPPPAGQRPECYVSYKHGNEDDDAGIARTEAYLRVKARLTRLGFKVISDETLGRQASINEFTQRISRGDHIVLIVSADYLRSHHCLDELHETRQFCRDDRDFRSRATLVVLPDTQLYEPEDWLRHRRFWEDRMAAVVQEASGAEALLRSAPATAMYLRYQKYATNLDSYLATIADSLHATGLDDIEALTFG